MNTYTPDGNGKLKKAGQGLFRKNDPISRKRLEKLRKNYEAKGDTEANMEFIPSRLTQTNKHGKTTPVFLMRKTEGAK